MLDPKDYKEYFDWKEIGDHIMKRALEILPKLHLNKYYIGLIVGSGKNTKRGI